MINKLDNKILKIFIAFFIFGFICIGIFAYAIFQDEKNLIIAIFGFLLIWFILNLGAYETISNQIKNEIEEIYKEKEK